MDDSPDKLRRNVMLIGIVILSIPLLKLTLKPSGSVLGIIEIGSISPLKTWLLLLILMTYFFLRYFYSDQVAEDRKKMKSGRTKLRIKAAYNLLCKQIQKYLKSGIQPSCITTKLPSLSLHDQHLRPSLRFKISIDTLEHNCSTGSVTIKYEKPTEKKANPHTIMEYKNLSFSIPKHLQLKILFSTELHLITLSKSSVDLVAPFAISLISLIICTYKTVTLLLPTGFTN